MDKRRGYRRSGFSDYAGTALDASNRRWKAIATAVRYETSPEPKGRALVELAEFAAANGKPDLSAAFLKALEDELGCCCRPREVPPPPPEDKAPREEKGAAARGAYRSRRRGDNGHGKEQTVTAQVRDRPLAKSKN